MSNTALAEIIIPIVVGIALAAWIIAIYRADKNPRFSRSGRASQPRREVFGGSFRGRGGRQLMPLPNTEPDERNAAPDERNAAPDDLDAKADHVDFAERGDRDR
jgi:hypothetical protein